MTTKNTPHIPMEPQFDAKLMTLNVVDDAYNPSVLLPPLYMQVNPQNMVTAYAKKMNRYQTFSAFVEEHWGDELDTITCNNSTGGFYLKDLGLTNILKSATEPYQRFQDILDVYKNNGNYFNSSGRIIKKGNVVLNFDTSFYLGYFESFTYTESASNPFVFKFDFVYKVEKSYSSI